VDGPAHAPTDPRTHRGATEPESGRNPGSDEPDDRIADAPARQPLREPRPLPERPGLLPLHREVRRHALGDRRTVRDHRVGDPGPQPVGREHEPHPHRTDAEAATALKPPTTALPEALRSAAFVGRAAPDTRPRFGVPRLRTGHQTLVLSPTCRETDNVTGPVSGDRFID